MFGKLFRKYNQNRKTIWTILIFIAFFVILLQAIFGLIRANRDRKQQQLINNYYQSQAQNNTQGNSNHENNQNNTNNQTIVQAPDKITTSSSAEDVINYFVNLCNEAKIEEAYQMVSTDCKSVLFPTIQYFKNNYYDKVFTQKRNVKIQSSMYGANVYAVTYTNDLLTSGGYNSSNAIQDYIYVIKENNEAKVSLNQFLKIEEINKTGSNNNISVRAIRKKVYTNYEEYQIQITNNTQEKIYVTPDEKKVYMLDENNTKYTSSIDELQNGETLIEPNKSSIIELRFQKTWRNKRCKSTYFFRNYY